MQKKIESLVESTLFQNIIIALIVINAATLGLETSPFFTERYGVILETLDTVILNIFVAEILLRLYVHRLDFFTRPWCILDFLVVSISLIPAAAVFSALRTLRILRVLRIISTVPSLRTVVEGLLTAIPGIIAVSSILLIFFYVFGVIGTHFYGKAFPEFFGTLGKTMFTLFQVMTLESWAMDVVRPVMETYHTAWIFFTLYILVTTFTMLNLFVAIIVNAMHSDSDQNAEKSRIASTAIILEKISALEKHLKKQKK